MTLLVGLMVLGFALIMVEIFVPGGIVGAFGGICLIASVVVAFQDYGLEGAIIVFILSILGLAVCLYVEFKYLPQTPMGRRLFLGNSVSGKSQPDVGNDELLGKEGVTLTDLSPSGYVLVEGQKLEASSCSGYLHKGEKVKVDSFDQFKVSVSKL